MQYEKQQREIAHQQDFIRRFARSSALPAPDIQTQFMLAATDAFLERAAGRCCYARGMPVEPEHAAQALKPEGVLHTIQETTGSELDDHQLRDGPAQPFHAVKKPSWRPAAVQRKIRMAAFHLGRR